MDVMLMKMQEIGKDKFLLGFQHHDDTVGGLIDQMISALEEYKENHKEELQNKTEFGFRCNLEVFEKRENYEDKFK